MKNIRFFTAFSGMFDALKGKLRAAATLAAAHVRAVSPATGRDAACHVSTTKLPRRLKPARLKLAAVLIVMLSLAGNVTASDPCILPIANGTAGDNVRWTLCRRNANDFRRGRI